MKKGAVSVDVAVDREVALKPQSQQPIRIRYSSSMMSFITAWPIRPSSFKDIGNCTYKHDP